MMTRRDSLALLGSTLLAACNRGVRNAVQVSSDPEIPAIVAAVYAAALQRARIPAILTASADADVSTELTASQPLEGFIPSPATIGPALVTSQYAAEQFWLLTLEKCAKIAPRLRLAATPEFLRGGGEFDAVRRAYGGFRFATIIRCNEGEQYDALSRGDADVANGSTVAASVATELFVVLRDNRNALPSHHVVPIVRPAVMARCPSIRPVLNRVSRTLTQYAVQGLAMRANLESVTLAEVAEDFLDRVGRLR